MVVAHFYYFHRYYWGLPSICVQFTWIHHMLHRHTHSFTFWWFYMLQYRCYHKSHRTIVWFLFFFSFLSSKNICVLLVDAFILNSDSDDASAWSHTHYTISIFFSSFAFIGFLIFDFFCCFFINNNISYSNRSNDILTVQMFLISRIYDFGYDFFSTFYGRIFTYKIINSCTARLRHFGFV